VYGCAPRATNTARQRSGGAARSPHAASSAR
jgi:hypothetical protein